MSEPAVVAVAFFPLSRAMICLNTDETIFDRDFTACPHCGSPHIMPLARWLGSVNGEESSADVARIVAWAEAQRAARLEAWR